MYCSTDNVPLFVVLPYVLIGRSRRTTKHQGLVSDHRLGGFVETRYKALGQL